MNKTYKLVWIDQVLIFIFMAIILTLYHLFNVYVTNISKLFMIVDIIVLFFTIFIFGISLIDDQYNDFTLKTYQTPKLFLEFMIALNFISLFNPSNNYKDSNSFMIFSLICFALVLFLFMAKFSPILHDLRIKAIKNNIKKEQIKKLKN